MNFTQEFRKTLEPDSSSPLKTCAHCGRQLDVSAFIHTNSLFYPDGYSPWCAQCIEELLVKNEFNWDTVDKICQFLDIPFKPDLFEDLKSQNGSSVFPIYCAMFTSQSYEKFNWSRYFQHYQELEREREIESEIPLLRDEQRKKLIEKWGGNYDDMALNYLENLFNGLLTTQNVNGALQSDQALKICKLSYEIDRRISEGSDFDKILTAYDKLVKTAEFTPKNVKNINDLESVGELTKWMEKRGWKNKFFDGVNRDIVDATIQNFQNYNRRLYTNESNIADQIEHRIESLKSAAALEKDDSYGQETKYDQDQFDVDGYDELMSEEEFELELGEGANV